MFSKYSRIVVRWLVVTSADDAIFRSASKMAMVSEAIRCTAESQGVAIGRSADGFKM